VASRSTPITPDVIYLGAFDTGTGLFKSVDADPVRSLNVAATSGRSHRSTHAQTIYAGNFDGGVLRSLDGGERGQTRVPACHRGKSSRSLIDPNVRGRVRLGKGRRLFVSRNGGGSWTAADTGEALRRSGAEAGRAAMVVTRRRGPRLRRHSGVLQIDTLGGKGLSAKNGGSPER